MCSPGRPYLLAGTSAWFVGKYARAASGSSGQSCGCGWACCCCPQGWQTRGSREGHTRGGALVQTPWGSEEAEPQLGLGTQVSQESFGRGCATHHELTERWFRPAHLMPIPRPCFKPELILATFPLSPSPEVFLLHLFLKGGRVVLETLVANSTMSLGLLLDFHFESPQIYSTLRKEDSVLATGLYHAAMCPVVTSPTTDIGASQTCLSHWEGMPPASSW